jgi:Fe-S cluster biosynthesis and repair protein YggX
MAIFIAPRRNLVDPSTKLFNTLSIKSFNQYPTVFVKKGFRSKVAWQERLHDQTLLNE